MLFLALILYMVLYPMAYWALKAYGTAVPFLPLLIAAFSIAVVAVFAHLVCVYQPNSRRLLRELLRLPGVRWLCLVSALGTTVALVFSVLYHEHAPSSWVLSLVLPAIAVMSLNAFGTDVPLGNLDPDEKPGMVVLPATEIPESAPAKVPSLPKVPQTDIIGEEIVKKFGWNYKGKENRLDFYIRKTCYENFQGRPRVLDHTSWSKEYVSDGITGEVHGLAAELFRIGHPYGTFDEVSFVLSFVQQIVKYTLEEGEYPRYPVETLAESTGDCEDYAILGAAILKCMGYEVALLYVPGHAALGVAGASGIEGTYIEHEGFRYYYCEMTGTGWQFGQLPADIGNTDIEVSPVPPLKKIVTLQPTAGA
jgi:hypothetical protein